MRPILVAVDGSEPSLRAVDEGARLARQAKAELIILTAAPLPDSAPDLDSHVLAEDENDDLDAEDAMANEAEDAEAAAENAAARSLLDAARRRALKAGSHDVQTALLHGDTVPEILDAIEDAKPSLVVVGRRGLGALRAALLGSVSSAIVRESPSPVMVVP
jgi:nucleotide-binding universal stress UspA family protein